MKINEKVNGKILGQDHNGRGILKIDRFPIFIEGALPDDEGTFLITDIHKSYAEGKIINLDKISNMHQMVLCQYYKDCGGCNLLHQKYEHQLNFKKEKVHDIIRKFANLDIDINDISSISEYNYRNKVVLHIENGKFGFYNNNSKQLIGINNCLLLSPIINNIIKNLKSIELIDIEEIIIRVSDITKQSMLYIKGKNVDVNLFNDIDITTIIINDNIIKGKGYIEEKLNNLVFNINYKSFFQVNTLGCINIYDKIVKFLDKNDKVLDLYCGVGSITLYISNYVNKAIGVEVVEAAIDAAKINKKINNINNVEFICSNTDNIENIKDINTIIVDPPRSGLTKRTIDKILEMNPHKLLYISCDPITLARDLNILKNNYDIKELSLVDMFPNTYHVECVVILNKK